ncbi:hypothetical protein V1511DRAFT_456568 [Dipodascopsis uninucleata]
MDHSSPLAAMMPPPLYLKDHENTNFQPLFRRSTSQSSHHHGHEHKTSLPNMPLKDLELLLSPSFDSPTTTLAADLSQNFHIAKSPVVPTPRRSLLPSFAFGAKSSKLTKTPPVSSSPNGDSSMEVSPLPHKSSRPLYTSSSSSSFTSSSVFTASSSLASFSSSSSSSSSFLPPSSDRTCSTGRHGVSRKGSESFTYNRLAPPSFSPALDGVSNSDTLSFEEIYANSPRNRAVGFGIDTPRSKTSSSLAGGFLPAYGNGDSSDSPLAALSSRASTNKFARAKFRRTQSMYQNSSELMASAISTNQSLTAAAAAAATVCKPSPLSPPSATKATDRIPCFLAKQDDPFKRITPATLVDIIDGKYSGYYDRHMVVDCRFEYEYTGGHIAGAINVNSSSHLEEMFLSKPQKGRILLIFHCEYSAHRAPRMALHLRNRDRHLNMHDYPNLHYPDIYILDGGYKHFFQSHRARCDPQCYVEMTDSNHRDLCEREMNKFRKNMRFTRAQSYTFGSHTSNGPTPSSSVVLSSGHASSVTMTKANSTIPVTSSFSSFSAPVPDLSGNISASSRTSSLLSSNSSTFTFCAVNACSKDGDVEMT